VDKDNKPVAEVAIQTIVIESSTPKPTRVESQFDNTAANIEIIGVKPIVQIK
jgi:hypothetical protein